MNVSEIWEGISRNLAVNPGFKFQIAGLLGEDLNFIGVETSFEIMHKCVLHQTALFRTQKVASFEHHQYLLSKVIILRILKSADGSYKGFEQEHECDRKSRTMNTKTCLALPRSWQNLQ